MSRPHKQTVDYFPHVTKPGRTLFILERRYGNDGYSFWFKLLEVLGATEGHAYDLNDIHNREYLWARTNMTEERAMEILASCAELEAIDKELFAKGVIWSANFVQNLEHLYKKRTLDAPDKPVIDDINKIESDTKPHSIVKDSIVKDSIDSLIPEIINDLNHVTGKTFRATTNQTVKHINGRLSEGYTLEDFKRVHRVKFAEWGNDSNMEQYLRPSTLYRPGNFESYMNKRTAEEIQEIEKAVEYKKEKIERIEKINDFIEQTTEKIKGMPDNHPDKEKHEKAIGRAQIEKSNIINLEG